MAPQGSADFLAWMQDRSAPGQMIDAEAAEQQVQTLAAASQHVGLVEPSVRFHAALAEDRVAAR